MMLRRRVRAKNFADVDAEDSVLNRQGIPVSSASDNDDSDTDQEQEGSKGQIRQRGSGSFMSRRTAAAKGPLTQSVGIGPQTEQEFIPAHGEYAPIHAERSLSPPARVVRSLRAQQQLRLQKLMRALLQGPSSLRRRISPTRQAEDPALRYGGGRLGADSAGHGSSHQHAAIPYRKGGR